MCFSAHGPQGTLILFISSSKIMYCLQCFWAHMQCSQLLAEVQRDVVLAASSCVYTGLYLVCEDLGLRTCSLL